MENSTKSQMDNQLQKLKITYWSDYACPFCYIGETRLEKALKELDLVDITDVQMKAFELDPNADSSKPYTSVDILLSRKYGIPLESAKAQVNRISSLGQEEGIDFKFANVITTRKDVSKIIHLLFNAYYTKNVKLSDREILLDLAEKVGLEKQEVIDMLSSKDFIKEVRRDEMEAYKMGVHGVPFFTINGKYTINGCESISRMKQIITDALTDQLGESAHGMYCGVDGCH
ncbi:hypothetical protein PIROE2DRAFT_20086 [Piromyces sp. E2]|nr:hypothetical protein PIROE2DRAFT_20086 [Piromyces sp. E2]|eukprot:OUM67004.1 hypothetical protein PIROE2DRAFT_20086 [Piromyces sp. E2]